MEKGCRIDQTQRSGVGEIRQGGIRAFKQDKTNGPDKKDLTVRPFSSNSAVIVKPVTK